MPSWKKIIVSGSDLSQLTNDSGYARTGSANTFYANQTINGNLVVTGSITALQYIVSSSVIYITSSNFSGSNVFGNTMDDTHQFTGSVYITGSYSLIGNSTHTGSVYHSGSQFQIGTFNQTGSLNISGSTTQIGNNNLLGNTTLSGSITISGSTATPATPTIKIYGDMETNGVIKFLPVVKTIDNTISGSYIYVSGSTNDLYFSQNGSGYSNATRLRWLESTLYTGLLRGGNMTSTPGSTTFTVASGSGIIINQNASLANDPFPTVTTVSWPQQTLPITYSGSAKISYIGIDNTGTVIQQPYAWGSLDVTQWDTAIHLGVVLHLSGSVSTGVYNSPQISYGPAQRQDDFFRAFGPLKVSGHTLLASGSTLGLRKAAGSSYKEGANYIINPNHPSTVTENAITTSKIYRYHLSGSTPVIDTGVANAGYSEIDPTRYVNTTTGLLTTVTGNNSNQWYWTIQRVFWVPNSPTNAFIVYYGNAEYSTLIDAKNGIDTEAFTEAPNTALNAILIGYILVRKGCTDLSDTTSTNAVLIQGGLFRTVGGIGGSGASTITSLATLSDVTLTSPTNGDLLQYSSSAAKWINTKTLSGSYTLSGSLNVSGSLTGSLFGSSSYALTASYALNGGSGTTFPFTGSAIITGSLIVTGSTTSTLGFTGSLFGTASRATTASLALSASTVLVNTVGSAPEYGVVFAPSGRFSTLNINQEQFTFISDSTSTLKLLQPDVGRSVVFNFGNPTTTAARGNRLNVSGSINIYRAGADGEDNLLVLSGSSYPIMRVRDAAGTSDTVFDVWFQKAGIPSKALSIGIAGDVFTPGISNSNQQHVMMFNTASGQLTYVTASTFGGGGGGGATFNGGTNVDNRLITATGGTPELNGEANLTFNGSTLTVTGNVSASSFTGSLLGTASFATTASFASLAPLYLPLAGGTMTGNISAAGRTFSIQDLVIGFGTTFGTIKTDGNKYIGMYPNSGVESTRFLGNGNVIHGTAFTDTGFRLQVSASGAVSGALQVIGTTVITGSLRVSGSITGSLLGTASYALNTAVGGLNTQIQFNSASVLSGSNNFRFDYVTNNLSITGSITTSQSAYPFTAIDTKAGYIYGPNWSNTDRAFAIDLVNNRLVSRDINNSLSIDWNSRIIYDSPGNVALNYSNTTTPDGVRLYGTSSYALTASIANQATTASYALNSGTVVTQSFSSLSTWTFTHNLNRREVAVAVFDSSYNQIIPQTLNLTDANTATITFTSPRTGFAVATFGGATTPFQAASIDNINVGTPSTELYNYMVRAQELEQSKHSTINIYNSINFI